MFQQCENIYQETPHRVFRKVKNKNEASFSLFNVPIVDWPKITSMRNVVVQINLIGKLVSNSSTSSSSSSDEEEEGSNLLLSIHDRIIGIQLGLSEENQEHIYRFVTRVDEMTPFVNVKFSIPDYIDNDTIFHIKEIKCSYKGNAPFLLDKNMQILDLVKHLILIQENVENISDQLSLKYACMQRNIEFRCIPRENISTIDHIIRNTISSLSNADRVAILSSSKLNMSIFECVHPLLYIPSTLPWSVLAIPRKVYNFHYVSATLVSKNDSLLNTLPHVSNISNLLINMDDLLIIKKEFIHNRVYRLLVPIEQQITKAQNLCLPRSNLIHIIVVQSANNNEKISTYINSIINQSYTYWKLWIVSSSSVNIEVECIMSKFRYDSRINYCNSDNSPSHASPAASPSPPPPPPSPPSSSPPSSDLVTVLKIISSLYENDIVILSEDESCKIDRNMFATILSKNLVDKPLVECKVTKFPFENSTGIVYCKSNRQVSDALLSKFHSVNTTFGQVLHHLWNRLSNSTST
jgi:hypothetical protein